MIDLTPLEVRKKKGDFRRAMRGYDPLLVDDFLDLVADRLEELVRENLALQESIGRQEQQVADYRDREKALTEALVSAQEMREEVRRQAAREAEEALRSAKEEAAQLRAAVEQESRELQEEARRDREEARREREEARREREEALKEIADLRAEAEVDTRARADTQPAAPQRAPSLPDGSGQPEEQLQQLYARQKELISNYRAMLERELAELEALAPGVGSAAAAPLQQTPASTGTAPDRPAPPPPWEGTGEEADQAALTESDVAAEAALTMGVTPAALVEFEAQLPVPEPFGPEPSEPESLEPPFEPALLEEEPFEGEPFEPEPFQPDDDLAAFTGDDVAEAYEEERGLVGEGSTDITEVSGDGLEARLYDGIAADESGDGVPGPIGLGEAEPAPWEAEPWTLAPAADDDVFDLDDGEDVEEEQDDDPETAALLRNAAAAGYRLGDDDIPDEPATDEPTAGSEDRDADDDGWLPGLLDDDRE